MEKDANLRATGGCAESEDRRASLVRPRLTNVTAEALQSLTQQVIEALSPQRVYLFGSRAWGQPRWDSDVDLFIVQETSLPRPQRAQAVSSLFPQRRFALDIIVFTPAELAEGLARQDFLVKKVVEEGRLLYERP
jgi:predicted nucleotidyltransferase